MQNLFLRFFPFLWKYKYRLLLGVFFGTVAAFSNLVSLTAFIPVFNYIENPDKKQIFEISSEEKRIYGKYLSGEVLENYERLYLPWVKLKYRINSYFEGKSRKEVIFTIIGVIIPVYLLKILAVVASIFFFGTAGFYAARDLRNRVIQKLDRMEVAFFEKERTGYIISRVVNDTHLVAKTVAFELQETIINLLYIITHVALLLAISWKMFLFLIITVPLFMNPVNRLATKVKKYVKSQQERISELLSHIQEVISGIRVIRAYAMEKFEETRFHIINEKLLKDNFRVHYYHQVGPAISELVITFIVLVFLLWGAYEITRETLSKGQFFAFFFTLLFVMKPVVDISVMLNAFGVLNASLDRIYEILDSRDEEVPPGGIVFENLKESIEFRNVSFAYRDRDVMVLNNVTLTIPKNKVIAIVGESGSGKSTLIDLLFRFYEPLSGEILIDSINLRNYDIHSVRKKIGIVPQNIFLFHATILENITLFNPSVPFEKVVSACKMAYIHDFIESLPEKYNTMVGERGVMLSGGQKQRIAIARALVYDPEILIFDEATSALDSESERMVELALEEAIKNKTVVIIAHRFRSVLKADKIYVLDKGSIVEEGTHSELLEKKGIYKKLYELQFSS